MRGRAVVALALLVASFAVYGQVRGHEFLDYDDPRVVVENPRLREGLGWESIGRAFSEPYFGNWIPLTSLSLLVGHELHGPDPAGYLLTNVLLHALAAVVLFLALARATGATGRSAFVAGVFALHPLHVESVAWASERKDVLSGLFFTLTLLAYVRYAERPGAGRWAIVGVLLLLGLLAKPMLVTLPGVLLLLDYWPLGRAAPGAWPRLLLEKLPWLAACAAVGLVAMAVQDAAGAMFTLEQLPLPVRLANALESYVLYVVDSFWPSGLAAFHPHPLEIRSPWIPAGCALLLLAATAAALRLRASRPYLLVGWLWYLGMLLPVIGLVQVGMQARADRYAYLPQIGLALAVAWAAADADRLRARARPALAAAAILVLAAFAAVSWRQVGYWRDSIALHRRTVSVYPEHARVRNHLATTLLRQGQLDEAELHYREAVRLEPDWGPPQLGIADLLAMRGQRDAAIERYDHGLRLAPENGRAHVNAGRLLLEAGRFEEARRHLQRGMALGESSADLHGALALASKRVGRDPAAARHYRRARQLAPESEALANNMAWLLATSPDARVRDPEQALRLSERLVASEEPALLDTRAAALAAAGRFDEAERVARTAVAIAAQRGDAGFADEIAVRLRLYASGAPYVEPLPGARP